MENIEQREIHQAWKEEYWMTPLWKMTKSESQQNDQSGRS